MTSVERVGEYRPYRIGIEIASSSSLLEEEAFSLGKLIERVETRSSC